MIDRSEGKKLPEQVILISDRIGKRRRRDRGSRGRDNAGRKTRNKEQIGVTSKRTDKGLRGS